MATIANKGLKFEILKGKRLDSLDIGLRIAGHKTFWCAASANENKPGRFWKVLRKEDLTQDALEFLESHNYGIFASGNTIRKGDLTLHYAPIEVVDSFNRDKQQLAQDQLGLVTRQSFNNKHLSLNTKETDVRKIGATDSFND